MRSHAWRAHTLQRQRSAWQRQQQSLSQRLHHSHEPRQSSSRLLAAAAAAVAVNEQLLCWYLDCAGCLHLVQASAVSHLVLQSYLATGCMLTGGFGACMHSAVDTLPWCGLLLAPSMYSCCLHGRRCMVWMQVRGCTVWGAWTLLSRTLGASAHCCSAQWYL